MILRYLFSAELKKFRDNAEKILRKELDTLQESKKGLEDLGVASLGRLDWFMREYHANVCDSCGKGFLAHYGGFYKSYIRGKMYVFCSSQCLDREQASHK